MSDQPRVALDDEQTPVFSDAASAIEGSLRLGSPVLLNEPTVTPATPTVFPEEPQKYYSTAEVAQQFFGKSTQWLHWGSKDKGKDGKPVTPVFVYADGRLIEPLYVGKGRHRRYTLPIIREMALACYRRGSLKEAGLREVLGRIEAAERSSLLTTS